MNTATSGAPAAVISPDAVPKTMALTIATRCNVPRASKVPRMSISADVTATG